MTFSISLQQEKLSQEQIQQFHQLRNKCAGAIVEMTTLATCGHPGGSLSSLDFLLLLYSLIQHNPQKPDDPARDRVFISHGHISPGVYSALGSFGYFPLDDAIVQFRKTGTPFGGHVEICVPGVEWSTGNLGQGLSAAAGSALSARIKGASYKAICCMGDGEQQKGQISEARRFAVKNKLSNLIAFVDWNGLQIGGDIQKIMPQNIEAEWKASGWNVLVVNNGHNYEELYSAFQKAYLGKTENPNAPTVLLAKTIMGKGISWMEGDHNYHGKTPTVDQARTALAELKLPDRMEILMGKRASLSEKKGSSKESSAVLPYPEIKTGEPVLYEAKTQTDCRSAYGKALEDLARLNNQEKVKVLGLTCDLEGSVKMDGLRKASPSAFFESGIQEHNAAVIAGRLSKEGFSVFFSTFGVFGGSEVYNQQRLNDYNHTMVKVVCTHCGLDVGEDGPTHQCIDFIGLFQNLFSFSIFSPADPNQCDRMIRYMAARPENFFVSMGRSKMLPIAREDGTPFFDKNYTFVPGKADTIREGSDGAIFAFGPTLAYALEAHHILKGEGLGIRVVNMASLKPIDQSAVLQGAETGLVVTVEDHHVETGLGSMVGKILADHRKAPAFRRLGVHQYSSSGIPKDLYQRMGLDGKSIAKAVRELRKG